MARFAGPRHKLLLSITVAVVLLGLAAASHFRGGSIQWRPVDPVNFTGEVSSRHACILLDTLKRSEVFEQHTTACSFVLVDIDTRGANCGRKLQLSPQTCDRGRLTASQFVASAFAHPRHCCGDIK